MFHANAWGMPHAAPLTGAKLVLPGKDLDGKSLFDLMQAERVTFSAGVPTVWLGLLNYMKEARCGCRHCNAG
jgi:fatty-acyl-CoA synthase